MLGLKIYFDKEKEDSKRYTEQTDTYVCMYGILLIGYFHSTRIIYKEMVK